MKELEIFRNEEFGEVRTIVRDGEKILFCGLDVAKTLGYANPPKAIADHCRCITKRSVPHPQSPGKTLEMLFITEGDVYRLIARSRLPAAEQFESWLFDDVVPSIRKHGAYMTPEKLSEVRENPAALAALANALASEQNARQLAEDRADRVQAELDDLKERSEIAFSLMDDSGAILVRDLATLLTRRGFKIGQKSLYKYFVENGYLVKCDNGKYAPTLKGGESGFFYTKFQTAYTPYGRPVENRVTMVTSSGVRHFLNTISSPC